MSHGLVRIFCPALIQDSAKIPINARQGRRSRSHSKPLRWRPGSSQLEHVCPPIIFIMMRIPGKFSSVFFWSLDNKDNDPWGLSTNIQWFCRFSCMLLLLQKQSKTDNVGNRSPSCRFLGLLVGTPGNIYSYFTKAHQGRRLLLIISQCTECTYTSINQFKGIIIRQVGHYSSSSEGGLEESKIYFCLESITIQLSLLYQYHENRKNENQLEKSKVVKVALLSLIIMPIFLLPPRLLSCIAHHFPTSIAQLKMMDSWANLLPRFHMPSQPSYE